MKKLLSWEKYYDCLDTSIKSPKDVNEDEIYAGPPIEEDDEESIGNPDNKVILTPFGLLTIMDGSLAAHHFDFWIMHVNFDITEEIVQKISQIRGVESLEVLSRYRARIGFPVGETKNDKGEQIKMFDSTLIKKDIENILLQNTLIQNIELDQDILNSYNEEVLEEFENLKPIFSQVDYWAVLILPNGNLEYVATDSLDEFSTKCQVFETTASMTGAFFTSNELYNGS